MRLKQIAAVILALGPRKVVDAIKPEEDCARWNGCPTACSNKPYCQFNKTCNLIVGGEVEDLDSATAMWRICSQDQGGDNCGTSHQAPGCERCTSASGKDVCIPSVYVKWLIDNGEAQLDCTTMVPGTCTDYLDRETCLDDADGRCVWLTAHGSKDGGCFHFTDRYSVNWPTYTKEHMDCAASGVENSCHLNPNCMECKWLSGYIIPNSNGCTSIKYATEVNKTENKCFKPKDPSSSPNAEDEEPMDDSGHEQVTKTTSTTTAPKTAVTTSTAVPLRNTLPHASKRSEPPIQTASTTSYASRHWKHW